jgi:hypothetical protein
MAALGAGLGFLTISAVAFAPTNLAGVCGAAVSTSLALLSFAWAMAAAIALKNPQPRTELFRINPAPNPLPRWGLALAVAGTLGLSHLLGLIVTTIDGPTEGALAQVNALLADTAWGTLVGAALALAIAPALSEEILFRGLLLGRFCDRLGTPGGLALSSLLFGMIHLNLAQGAPALVLGLYFGALTLRTGSVRAAILCHGINNLVAVFAGRWMN